MLNKSRYHLSVNEGKDLVVSEIRVIRVDGESLTEEEIEELKTEFNRIFSNETYSVRTQTLPAEDNTALHVYINLTQNERRNRSVALGARVIVKRVEIEDRLQAW